MFKEFLFIAWRQSAVGQPSSSLSTKCPPHYTSRRLSSSVY